MNRNKKTILSILLIFLLIFQYSLLISADNGSLYDINDEENLIKSKVEEYFNNELMSIKENKLYDSAAIVKNKEFRNYVDTNNRLKVLWYNKIDEKLTKYVLYLNFNSIDFSGNKCIVDLDKGCDLVFEKNSDIVQKARGDNHILVLKKYDDSWYIEADIYEEGIKAKEIYDSKKIYDLEYKNKSQKLKYNCDNIDRIVDEYRGKLIPSKKNNKKDEINHVKSAAYLYLNYDGYDAASYAQTYYTDYNTNFPSFTSDCTNFASQCINAGGIPMSTTWYCNSLTNYSTIWIRVIELRDYLVNGGIAVEYTWQSNCMEGDLIQLYSSTYARWYHTLIISYRRYDGQLFVCAHTSDRLNYALYNYYPDSLYWSDIRFLKLTQ